MVLSHGSFKWCCLGMLEILEPWVQWSDQAVGGGLAKLCRTCVETDRNILLYIYIYIHIHIQYTFTYTYTETFQCFQRQVVDEVNRLADKLVAYLCESQTIQDDVIGRECRVMKPAT
jgi:hypothetical protein